MSEEVLAKAEVPKDEGHQDEEKLEAANEMESNKTITDKKTDEEIKVMQVASEKEAYFAALRTWATNANTAQNAMSLFPMYMYSQFPQMFQPQMNFGMPITFSNTMPMTGFINHPNIVGNNRQQAGQIPVVGGNEIADDLHIGPFTFLRVLNTQAQADLIGRTGGYEYTIAPFWKRGIAELIDSLIMLVVKTVITFLMINFFDWEWYFDNNSEAINQAMSRYDITSFFTISMEILEVSSSFVLLEFVIKLVVCLYETFWMVCYNGATPGKAVMNLRVVYCEAFVLLAQPNEGQQQQQQQQQRQGPQAVLPILNLFQTQRPKMKALIYPATNLSLFRAAARTVAKTLIVTLLFPICLIMVLFKHNRTSYDIFCKTVVVEDNPNPVLVHRANQ